MLHAYPIRFPAQLRPHLRALRKMRGLTQTQLGEQVGVSQARIAEIEANPGVVNFEQMLQLFSTLGVTVSLQENASASRAFDFATDHSVKQAKENRAPASDDEADSFKTSKDVQSASRRNFSIRQKKGTW
ncbi:helix-turn-helix domain-containing protein [Noviherbaspirillum sedimenti]|uniref:Helix-turn-helix domain-containing protein n=1 Tax=Noviherbaspirillum sedimenti TaxID=2320865 RepID=A0A3A3G5C0_9BURK|nr:helix-turn-helix domain-containing protein [Noviherbaspirillum sedimenti]RJG02875.1 helix-turn-helix domain-containing protein [Noviherbaspirillum sedimenti]